MRKTLITAIGLVLVAIFFYLDATLLDLGIAVRSDGQWKIGSESWKIFGTLQIWLAMLPASFIFSAIFVYFFYLPAHKADFERLANAQRREIQFIQDASGKELISAKNTLQSEFTKAKQLQSEAEEIKKRCEQSIQAAVKRVKEAEERANEAEKQAKFSATKQERVSFAHGKLKAKLKKLQSISE